MSQEQEAQQDKGLADKAQEKLGEAAEKLRGAVAGGQTAGTAVRNDADEAAQKASAIDAG